MKGVMILLLSLVVLNGLLNTQAFAASGKCTVVKVDGKRMVIECNQQTRGFSKGNQIKIKSDNKRAVQKN